jgi:hypothetical protein
MALPIWNFVLPIYSFWHFDDFTWGETRKVNGGDSNNKNARLIEEEENKKFFLVNNALSFIDRKLWHIWEKERLTRPNQEKAKRIMLIEHVASPPQSAQTNSNIIISYPLHPSSVIPMQNQQHMYNYHNNNNRVFYPPQIQQQQYYQHTSFIPPPPQFIQQSTMPSVLKHHLQAPPPNIGLSTHAFYQKLQQRQFLERRQKHFDSMRYQ